MSLQFIFDYRSPYAYLANSQLKTLPVPAEYISVDIVAVMDIVGNQPSPKCPAKARYSRMDAGRWARIYGVPMNPNAAAMQAMSSGQIEPDLFSRAALAAADLGVFDTVHDALFTAYWGIPVDLATPEGRTAFLRANSVDADIWQRAEEEDIRGRLSDNVTNAAQREVFGAPTFFVGDDMLFGNDRLAFVRDALAQNTLNEENHHE
ncbi:DsbA family protein [Pseudomonas sp. NyZ704]|nr:DsbA family protein [Pseudomonas sp. NyZ704]